MILSHKKINYEYTGILLVSVLSGLLISYNNLSVPAFLSLMFFVMISFKYFDKTLLFTILYIPFQIALNISSGIDLASGRVLILYLFAVWSMKSLADKKIKINFSLQTILLLLFLAIAVFSMLEAWDGERALRKTLVFLSVFPLYFLITAEENEKYAYKVLDALFVGGFIMSLIGIVQFALQFFIGIDPIMIFWSEIIAPIFYGETFGAEVVSNPSWLVNIGGATVLRAFSLFPDPHMFSFYLGLLIPIVLAIVININNANSRLSDNSKNLKNCHSRVGGNPVNRPFILLTGFPIRVGNDILRQSGWKVKSIIQSNKTIYFILITMLLAELLTFSRGGYLGLISGIGTVIILSWRYISFNKKIILGFIAGIFVLFIMFSNQSIVNRFLSSFNSGEGSNSERMKNWSQGWEVFSDNVLTGVGIGNYSIYLYPTADYRTPIYAHNLYLDIGAEMGIFALIAWLALIVITIYQLFKLSRSANDNFTRSISLGLIGSLVWFSIHGFFDTPIYSPTILAIFVIILSLAVMVLGDKTRKTKTAKL